MYYSRVAEICRCAPFLWVWERTTQIRSLFSSLFLTSLHICVHNFNPLYITLFILYTQNTSSFFNQWLSVDQFVISLELCAPDHLRVASIFSNWMNKSHLDKRIIWILVFCYQHLLILLKNWSDLISTRFFCLFSIQKGINSRIPGTVEANRLFRHFLIESCWWCIFATFWLLIFHISTVWFLNFIISKRVCHHDIHVIIRCITTTNINSVLGTLNVGYCSFELHGTKVMKTS